MKLGGTQRSWTLGKVAFALPAAALLLSGCTVGPNYHRPTAPTAPAFKESAVPVPPPTRPMGDGSR